MAHMPTSERRQQIVDAAVHVISHEGLASATTRRIAEVAGAPLGSLHYAFRSKEEIFAVVYEYTIGSAQSIYDSVGDGVGIEAAIRKGFFDALDWLFERPNEHIAQYELLTWAVRTPGMGDLAAKVFETYIKLVSEMYRRARTYDEKRFTNDVELGRLTIAAFDGVALQYLAWHDERRTRYEADIHVAFLTNYALS